MGAAVKTSSAAGSTPRPKKSAKTLVVTLKLSPTSLAKFEPIAVVKKEPESKATSSTESITLPVTASPPADNPSESNSNTPAPSGPDDTVTMPPPTDAIKKPAKTAVKRSSAQADGLLKPRGKPGPKKKSKIEEGGETIGTPKGVGQSGAVHKLGPKANQGAINAGLRALDRSGKPCRKWQKGSFQVKAFTGATWEIPRWRAPPTVILNGESEATSSGGSSKENKDSSQVNSEKSNSAGDIEMASAASMPASSPAPVIAVTA